MKDGVKETVDSDSDNTFLDEEDGFEFDIKVPAQERFNEFMQEVNNKKETNRPAKIKDSDDSQYESSEISEISSDDYDLTEAEKKLKAGAKVDKKLAENNNEYFKQVAINQQKGKTFLSKEARMLDQYYVEAECMAEALIQALVLCR